MNAEPAPELERVCVDVQGKWIGYRSSRPGARFRLFDLFFGEFTVALLRGNWLVEAMLKTVSDTYYHLTSNCWDYDLEIRGAGPGVLRFNELTVPDGEVVVGSEFKYTVLGSLYNGGPEIGSIFTTEPIQKVVFWPQQGRMANPGIPTESLDFSDLPFDDSYREFRRALQPKGPALGDIGL